MEMSEELRKVAEALAPYLPKGTDGVRPRPDLHADHDRRLSALETDFRRILSIVEDVRKIVEGQSEIDKRVTEIEAARRADAAAAQARAETEQRNAAARRDRAEWVRWAIPTAITLLPTLAFVLAWQIPK